MSHDAESAVSARASVIGLMPALTDIARPWNAATFSRKPKLAVPSDFRPAVSALRRRQMFPLIHHAWALPSTWSVLGRPA
jgi:hypothetical protein